MRGRERKEKEEEEGHRKDGDTEEIVLEKENGGGRWGREKSK